jgi:tRNA1Val (adenine37-N6)-methyltransferase
MASHLKDDSQVFTWQGLEIHQHHDVFKVGTDALLLGAWVPRIISSANFILDVGTGTGILALIMANRFPNAEVYAIDQDPKAIQLAQKNAGLSDAAGRIRVMAESILDQKNESQPSFDLIVSNPPYYNDQYPATSGYKAHAKHRQSSVNDWMKGIMSRIDPRGHLCVIIPFESGFHWIESANQFGYYCNHRLDVYSFPADETPVRSLLHFSSDLSQPQNERLTIYAKEKLHSDAYRTFTSIQPKRTQEK